MTYQVNEIFTSIQGEGFHMGVPATFIRLQGCTVGCSWCDTKYTWKKGGRKMVTSYILERVKTRHVVITGGEPTMYDLDPLIGELRARGKYIQLETSGQRWLKGLLMPDWITWSPKENLDWNAPNEYYLNTDEVKWVVDENLELGKVLETWEKMYSVCYFVFMPEGCPPRPEMVERAMELMSHRDYYYSNRWMYGDRLQYRIGVQ
jgi:organic radical activating enzyme